MAQNCKSFQWNLVCMEVGEGSNLSAEFTLFACNHTTHHGYKVIVNLCIRRRNNVWDNDRKNIWINITALFILLVQQRYVACDI